MLPVCAPLMDATARIWATELCSAHLWKLKQHGDPLAGRTQSRAVTPLADRIANNTVRHPDGCLLWQGAPGKRGHARMRYQGQTYLVHRVAWSLGNGPIPDGMQINHRCGVANCVEVTHLYLGTQAENMRDRIGHGTAIGASSQAWRNWLPIRLAISADHRSQSHRGRLRHLRQLRQRDQVAHWWAWLE